MSVPGYFLGVDGGGTKTEFALTDCKGHLLARCTLSGSNPHDRGMVAACETLLQGMNQVCGAVPRSEVSVFIGVAGATDPTTTTALAEFLSAQGFAKAGFGGDFYNILSAGLGEEPGLIAIMGTGCVVFGQMPDGNGGMELQRTGGWGHLLDNGGSGWRIGREALFAVLSHHDGSGPETVLTDLLQTKTGRTAPELIPEIYRSDKSYIAGFAPLVFAAAQQGDAAAQKILADNMKELARLLASALHKLPVGRGYRAVLAGGLTHCAPVLLPLLRSAIEEYDVTEQMLQLCILKEVPVYGALLRAGLTRTEESALQFIEG